MPLLAGPGAVSTPSSPQTGGLAQVGALLVCIALVCAFLWWILRIADVVGRRLGITGLNIATRLLGMLLAAIAVETMASGLKAPFSGLAP